MPFAKEQREEWQKELSEGNIPDDVQKAINEYKRLRESSTWRSSSFLERLGESAVAFEKLIKENKKNS